MTSLCVFCGSSPGSRAEYRAAAVQLGEELAHRGVRLVYGGGNIGLMGLLADAVLEAGGEVVGVIPHALIRREVAHFQVTELVVVDSMHERKARMAELSDGFLALPGGLGTLEEVCEILTWLQLGIHTHPVGLLNVAGFYDRLTGFLQHASTEGFIDAAQLAALFVDDEPARLLDRFTTWTPPSVRGWLEPGEA